MLNNIDIKQELMKLRSRSRKEEDYLIDEVHRILNMSLVQETNVLNNLKFYNKTFELLDDEELGADLIFKPEEIRSICTKYRLRFLDSKYFNSEIPLDAVLKIKSLNLAYSKDLKGFKILSSVRSFTGKTNAEPALLFVPTINGNYYLVHSWGRELNWFRNWTAFPMRNFETLSLTLAVVTLIITLLLPTRLITLDKDATYWCGYRIATFFHILIFNSGVTAYFTFAFNKNFSGAMWDSHNLGTH
jgi:hypothetical protein